MWNLFFIKSFFESFCTLLTENNSKQITLVQLFFERFMNYKVYLRMNWIHQRNEFTMDLSAIPVGISLFWYFYWLWTSKCLPAKMILFYSQKQQKLVSCVVKIKFSVHVNSLSQSYFQRCFMLWYFPPTYCFQATQLH